MAYFLFNADRHDYDGYDNDEQGCLNMDQHLVSISVFGGTTDHWDFQQDLSQAVNSAKKASFRVAIVRADDLEIVDYIIN